MRYLALFLSFVAALAASSSLAVGANATEEADKTVYTIQLFTQYDKKIAKEVLQTLPPELLPDAYLLKAGKSIKGRYATHEKYATLRPYLEQLQKAGFKDAFIVKSSSLLIQESRLPEDENSASVESKAEQTKQEKVQSLQTQEPKEKLTKIAKTDLLLKAQSAYERGDESEAMIYYEMLFASNEASQKAKNNLCYLYGKRGAWMQAKNIIEGKEFNSKLLYAYAYGAVTSNQESYYEDMLPYISLDSSGRLFLLTGYYFEKREEIKKATSFYKMAYEKNRSDHYHKYAYARALDIEQNQEALRYYKELLAQVETSHQLYPSIQKRVNKLGE